MKFLSDADICAWDKSGTPPVEKILAAAGLLVLAIFAMPLICQQLFSDRLSLPDILLFSSMPGVCAYGFFTASKLPFRPVSFKELLGLLGYGLLLLIVVGCVNLLWMALLKSLNIPFESKQFAIELVSKADQKQLIQLFFAFCIFTPLMEELLFRRIVYGALLRFGFLPALIGTALLFSFCHFFVAGIPGLFLLGIGFQLAYLKFRNFTMPVLLHALVNCSAFLAAINMD